MLNYFDDKKSIRAFQYASSLIPFMQRVSEGYLKSINAFNFDYIEYHKDGRVLNLTNNKILLQERFQRKMRYQILFADIIFSMEHHQPKIFLWPDNPNNVILETLFQLDVWNGCNVFIRQHDKIAVFSFSGNRENCNIRSNCNNNQKELFLFIHNFMLLFRAQFSMTKPHYIFTDIVFESPKCAPIKRLEIESGIFLTNKELKIAKYVSYGCSAVYIAEKLFSSPRTVETHIQNIKNKIYDETNCNMSKQELADFFAQKRWLLESVV